MGDARQIERASRRKNSAVLLDSKDGALRSRLRQAFPIMKINGIPTRTIRAIDNGAAVEIIDQTLLPYRFEKRVLSDWRDCVEAISVMRVRGAPLIGVMGAWAVALAVRENPENEPLLKAAETIQNVRPTAVNLQWAVQKMLATLLPREPSLRLEAALKCAAEITQADVETCRAIGEAGAGSSANFIQVAPPGQCPHALQRRLARDGRLRHGACTDLCCI